MFPRSSSNHGATSERSCAVNVYDAGFATTFPSKSRAASLAHSRDSDARPVIGRAGGVFAGARRRGETATSPACRVKMPRSLGRPHGEVWTRGAPGIEQCRPTNVTESSNSGTFAPGRGRCSAHASREPRRSSSVRVATSRACVVPMHCTHSKTLRDAPAAGRLRSRRVQPCVVAAATMTGVPSGMGADAVDVPASMGSSVS